MVSLEQKEKNRKYILDHFEEYVLDKHGNFVNVIDFEGTYDTDYFCIGKDGLTSEGLQEIECKRFENWWKDEEARKELGEKILRELESWELVYFVHITDIDDNLRCIRHKQSGAELDADLIDFESHYKIIGKLGYRKNIWENYEETIKAWDERDKKQKEDEEWWENFKNNNPDSLQSKANSKTPNTSNQNSELENKENNNPNKENQNPLSPNQDNPINNTLPPTDTQNQYNFDKDKPKIDNNSNLADNQKKQQIEEFLKLITIVESLIKKQQFDPEALTKLLNEKNQNSPLYQSLNKEKRIDRIISQLESIQQSQKNNNKSLKESKDVNTTQIKQLISLSLLNLFYAFLAFSRLFNRFFFNKS